MSYQVFYKGEWVTFFPFEVIEWFVKEARKHTKYAFVLECKRI